jgi:hypothetical protein
LAAPPSELPTLLLMPMPPSSAAPDFLLDVLRIRLYCDRDM